MRPSILLMSVLGAFFSGRVALAQSQALPSIDFSYAGYRASQNELPAWNVSRSLSPSGGDDSDRIQSALDSLGHAVPDATGHRGVVLLKPGIFHIRKPLFISDSGVVLRGSGSGDGGTHLRFGGAPRDGITVRGGTIGLAGGTTSIISPELYPGDTAIRVRSPSMFRPFQDIRISRPIFADRISSRPGKPGQQAPIGWQRFDRTIIDIMGDTLVLDAPLTDHFAPDDLQQGQTIVQRLVQNYPLQEVGIEGLSAGGPRTPGDASQPHFRLVHFDRLVDAWITDVATVNLGGGVVHIGPEARRITVSRVTTRRNDPMPRGQGLPVDVLVEGQQVLLEELDCEGDDVAYVAFGSLTTGPSVVRQLEGHGNARAMVGPLAPWVSGVLFEHIFLPGGTLGLGWAPMRDGKSAWASTQSVIYNSTAKGFAVTHPPFGENVCIGCSGRIVPGPDGDAFVAHDSIAEPQSLYLYQRSQRP